MRDNFEEVKAYIENIYGVKLFDFQVAMLKAMLNGDIYCAPRQCGRTMLLEGYKEYLDNKYSENCALEDADVIFRGLRSHTSFIDDPIDFKEEYVGEWRGKLKE